jgi:hypothetical protein
MALSQRWRFAIRWDGVETHKLQAALLMNHEGLHGFLLEHDFLKKSGASACKILSKIPPQYKHYWWRGYFDGDGSFVFDGATVRASIISCFDQDWTFAQFLENDLGIGYRTGYNRNDERSSSTINMEGEVSASKFMNYILQGEQFGLQRKYDVTTNIKSIRKTSDLIKHLNTEVL